MKSRYLTSNEIEKLKYHMDPRDFLPVRVMIETGLRIGDVVKIRPSDIKDGFLHYVAEKTKKSGKVKISDALIDALMRNSYGLWCFPMKKDPKRHLTRQAVWYRIKKGVCSAKIDPVGVSPHSFRKVFAVDMYSKFGLKATSEALQHSNTYTTEIYTLSDWTSGEFSDVPLRRADLPILISKILECIEALDKK